jgi:hypothetical protein
LYKARKLLLDDLGAGKEVINWQDMVQVELLDQIVHHYDSALLHSLTINKEIDFLLTENALVVLISPLGYHINDTVALDSPLTRSGHSKVQAISRRSCQTQRVNGLWILAGIGVPANHTRTGPPLSLIYSQEERV